MSKNIIQDMISVILGFVEMGYVYGNWQNSNSVGLEVSGSLCTSIGCGKF